jgi:hypothetical protein
MDISEGYGYFWGGPCLINVCIFQVTVCLYPLAVLLIHTPWCYTVGILNQKNGHILKKFTQNWSPYIVVHDATRPFSSYFIYLRTVLLDSEPKSQGQMFYPRIYMTQQLVLILSTRWHCCLVPGLLGHQMPLYKIWLRGRPSIIIMSVQSVP